MKFYQFILLFTFCSILINAYSINGDIPLSENLRYNSNKKEELHINIPMRSDVYVTNCRYRHDRKKVYCDFKDKDKKNLYLMIPITNILGKVKKNNVSVKKWSVYKRIKRDGEYLWPYTDEIMETGSFESIEVGDNYHGHFCIGIEGDGIDIEMDYERVIVSKY